MIFCEKIFASCDVRKNDIIPVISAIIKIKTKVFVESWPAISFIATAAPVRVFDIRYSEINEKPMTKVFVAPRRTRKPLLPVLEIVLPMIAA